MEKLILQCTRRLGEIWYIQCVYVINTILHLVQFSENVLNEHVVGILNKQNYSKYPHRVTSDGPLGREITVLF